MARFSDNTEFDATVAPFTMTLEPVTPDTQEERVHEVEAQVTKSRLTP